MIVVETILWLFLAAALASSLLRLRHCFSGLTPIVGWFVGLCFFIFIPLSVLTLKGAYTTPVLYNWASWASIDLGRNENLLPYLAIWTALMLCCAVIYLCVPASDGSGDVAPGCRLSRRALKRVIFFSMAVSVLNWLAMIRILGGLDAFLSSHWYFREEALLEGFGDAFVLIVKLAQGNQVVFTAAAALFVALQMQDDKYEWLFTALIGLFFLLEMLMSGNRIFIALFLLGFLASCWSMRKWKILARFLLLSPIVIVVFSAWATMRYDLSKVGESYTAYFEQDVRDRVATAMMDATEGHNVLLLFHVIHDFGPKYELLYGLSYSKALTFLVPRSMYPDKPDNFAVILAKLYQPEDTTSLSSTALGEAIANFGVGAGIILLPFFTWIAVMLSMHLSRRRTDPLILAVLFLVLSWMARSAFSDVAITMLFALGLVAVLHLSAVATPRPSGPERYRTARDMPRPA